MSCVFRRTIEMPFGKDELEGAEGLERASMLSRLLLLDVLLSISRSA